MFFVVDADDFTKCDSGMSLSVRTYLHGTFPATPVISLNIIRLGRTPGLMPCILTIWQS